MANSVQEIADRPLAGVRVLDLLVGPFAAIGQHFVELGADVIRVEPEGGAEDRTSGRSCEGVSIDFVSRNLGKRAATSDRFESLAAGADIILAPRGRVDADALRAASPALVVTSVSHFGDTHQFADWQGSEAVFLALSGELSRSGLPDREPMLPPEGLALACASVQAVFVTLVAYWQALGTGQGDHLDFSVLDGVAQALDPGYGVAGSATAGVPANKLPAGRPDASFMYPIIPCKDGCVRLCVLAPRQWQGMFEWMGRPKEFADSSFATLQVRFASTTLIPAMARFFADKTRAEIEAEAQTFGVPAAAVLSLEEALATEQIKARRAFVPVEIAPGVRTMLPDGLVEVDGHRIGIAGQAAPLPDSATHWRRRNAPPRPTVSGDRPLAGLKVLDFGVIVVGAEAGRLLGDQGADVIKVESSAFPDGARQNNTGGLISPSFIAGHRNKRSVGINLRDPRGKALVLDLVRQSDVLLSNFKGGTLASLGLDYAALRDVNPGIIVTDSSAFGTTGPWSARMGYGPLVRASTGLTMNWRYPGETASFSDALTVYPDHVAGRLALIGVIALLIRRCRTGLGGQISMSQAEVILSQMAPRIATELLTAAGHAVTPSQEESQVYACAGEDDWCVVTLRDDGDRDAVNAVTGGQSLEQWLAGQDVHEAMQTLQSAGIPAGAMLRVAELPDFAYFAERGFFRQFRHPHRDEWITVETVPVRAERMPQPPEEPAPLPGEHSVAIIRERLGLLDTDIQALIADGVLEQFRLR